MFKRLEKRRSFLVILALISVSFCGAVGALKYSSNQALAKQQSESSAEIAKLDKKIAEIKAKKLAEQKAAEQKAASDAALAAQLQGNVVTPKGCAVSGAHGDPSKIDVVINKKHCFNPVNYVPADRVSVYGGFVVSSKIVPNLTAMFDAAQAAGLLIGLTSSYRSYTDQVATYNNWVRVNGSTDAADTVSARPGYSEHQTGFAVDLDATINGKECSLDCFTGSEEYQWMLNNAAAYGFIERYPPGMTSVTGYSPEAWHWRYVGPAVAQEMKSKGIKTLEQLWNISGGGY
jgi:D-alanyl-D-alanine carboxypeptidase